MIDIHTHILPGIDDGAKDTEMSLQMLRVQREQGVDTVVLTPHCYRKKELPVRFLERRQAAFESLQAAIRETDEEFPQLILGAEVAWVPGLSDWEELRQLCIGKSTYMLLELPFHPWSDRMIDQLYELMGRGVTPVFAHLERYVKDQRKEYVREILSMGVPVQVSCEPLLHMFERCTVVKMLKKGQAGILASDCHNLTKRPPNLAQGMAAVQKLLGMDAAKRIDENTREILMEDLCKA